MYGLEKQPQAPFEFDLEKELKRDHTKMQQMLKIIDEKIHELKDLLRKGSGTAEFDQYGVLLQGYMALQKVIKRFANKK